jgi:hypothetical protein
MLFLRRLERRRGTHECVRHGSAGAVNNPGECDTVPAQCLPQNRRAECPPHPEAFARITVNMVRPLLPNIVRLRAIFIEYGAQENFNPIPFGASSSRNRSRKRGCRIRLRCCRATPDQIYEVKRRVKRQRSL